MMVTFKNGFVTEKSVLIFVTPLVSSLSIIFVEKIYLVF